ncbi:hypothetical protein ABW19_dt0204529 [Dactylella cylindrospora]|nr:hypothetical protein ABW19_dt0204529 [Dactylella cylindrospora]
MAKPNSLLIISIIALFIGFSNALTINWHERRSHTHADISRRDVSPAGHPLLRRVAKYVFTSSTTVSSSSRISLTVGGKKSTTSQAPSQYSGSSTLGNTAGHVSLDQVAGIVKKVGKSTCRGKGGVVTFKAETTETENSASFKGTCSVKSSTKSILTAARTRKCTSTYAGSYYDPILKQTIKKINDCNLKQQTLVYKDPEIGKDVALYKKGDFTIRRFYESDSIYKSNAYFVGCATNGNPVELGSKKKKRTISATGLSKRGFFKGNTKDPIWNCATPTADSVNGPKDSFMFAPANVGECLVIIASRECLEQDSVAFFWLDG